MDGQPLPPELSGSRLIDPRRHRGWFSPFFQDMHPNQIRQHYRRIRRELDSGQQQRNAVAVSCLIQQVLGFSHDRRIAAYLATQGELSLNPWIAGNTRQQIYLPKLYEPIAPRLRFAQLTGNTRWKRNRFDIVEPDEHWGDTLSARQLDIVLMPLVAFDRQGRRMGMGGGYYDRSLAFRNLRRSWRRPLLIGVAHGCQEHPQLPENPWDVRLDMIITEREIIRAPLP